MLADLRFRSVTRCGGRRGRRSTAKAWLIYGLLVPLLSALVFGTEGLGGFVDFAVSIWCALAVPLGVGTQRLHDMGRSGHWIWLVFVVPLAALNLLPPGFSLDLARAVSHMVHPWPEAVNAPLSMFVIWTLAAMPLLILPGQPATNWYGPPYPPGVPLPTAASDRAGRYPHVVPD